MERKIKKSELFKQLGNFKSVRQGEVKNELIIYFENGRLLQSYETPVAAEICGTLYLMSEHTYSHTTNRHVMRFCGYNTEARRKMLKEGLAIFVEKD